MTSAGRGGAQLYQMLLKLSHWQDRKSNENKYCIKGVSVDALESSDFHVNVHLD